MVIILIPAFNPDHKILDLIKELMAVEFKKVIVIDDGSEDSCRGIFDSIRELGGIVLTHCVNLGKGRAIKTGINYIVNNDLKCLGVVTVDADGQHKIADIRKCAEELINRYEHNNIILGCRKFVNQSGVKVPLRSRVGNLCTRYILRYLCNIHLMDTQTGLRGIPRLLLRRLMTVNGERYEYEMNMLLDLAAEGVSFIEVPIQTVYEDNNSVSHFNPLVDSVKIYSVIVKYSMASLLSALLDNLVFVLLSMYSSNILIMTFCGRATAAIFNFGINKKVVFKQPEGLWKQALKYICLLIVSGGVSALFVSVLHEVLFVNVIFTKLVVETFLYFVNFYFQKNFVFANKGGRKNVNKSE